MILGVVAFWLFAQTMLNIGPVMAEDLGIEVSVMTSRSPSPPCFPGFLSWSSEGSPTALGGSRRSR